MTKKLKVIFISIFIAAFSVYLAAPVFAYDEIPLEFNWIYKKNGDSAVYTWNNDYAYNIEGLNYIGMECGFPVPHYAGDGQYSLYFHFKFTCDQDPKPLFRMQISPYDSSLSLYPNTAMSNYLVNQLGQTDLFGELNQYNANLKNYWGTFRWMHKSTCNFNWVCMREKSPDYNNQYTYSVIGIMDLRLMEEDEMSPFRLGIEIANAQSYSTFTVYNVDMGLYAMDSSSTWALYDIWTTADEISSKLDNLSVNAIIDTSSIQRLINEVSANIVVYGDMIDDDLDDILDDHQPDADLTAAAERASEFQSEIEEYNRLQEELVGTLEEYTFPAAPSGHILNAAFTPFFSNEIVILLVAGVLAVLIACAILL